MFRRPLRACCPAGPQTSELYGKFTWKLDKFGECGKRELRSNVFEVGSFKWCAATVLLLHCCLAAAVNGAAWPLLLQLWMAVVLLPVPLLQVQSTCCCWHLHGCFHAVVSAGPASIFLPLLLPLLLRTRQLHGPGTLLLLLVLLPALFPMLRRSYMLLLSRPARPHASSNAAGTCWSTRTAAMWPTTSACSCVWRIMTSCCRGGATLRRCGPRHGCAG